MSSANQLGRVEIDTHQPGRIRRAWDTLQDTLRQPVRTVTRNATLNTIGTGVEDVDPPDAIPDYVDLYYDTGAIRTNLNVYRNDVIEPGIRVESDDDATADYFNGGDAAPEGAPENGFLSECYVFDEKRQPLDRALGLSTLDRWRRGTVLLVNIYAEPDDPDSIISGCTFVRPETVSARTYSTQNQLLLPDPDDPANADVETTLTPRGEAAAWVQFDENAILSRLGRRDFKSRSSVPLSQNDVHKLTLDQDVGGDDPEEGVFGESIIRSVSDEATELNNIKRDLETAVQDASMGFYTLELNDYVLEGAGENGGNVRVSWDDADIDAVMSEYDNLTPGEVLATDAKANLNRVDGTVPQIEWILRHYTRDIIDPLPAPFYKHSQAEEINQFVTDDQQEDYRQRVSNERRIQAAFYEGFLRDVARRHPDLTAEGLTVRIEPEMDASPVMSLDAETIDKISTFAGAMSDLYGPGGAPAFVQERILNELILQLPEDASPGGDVGVDDLGLDETDADVQEQFARLMNGE
jgi:hypothetical protein